MELGGRDIEDDEAYEFEGDDAGAEPEVFWRRGGDRPLARSASSHLARVTSRTGESEVESPVRLLGTTVGSALSVRVLFVACKVNMVTSVRE